MNIFFDDHNNFQWASIAALVALFSVLLQLGMQWYNNKQVIKANLIAKSRVEWIQNIRKLSADFIKIAYEYKGMMDKYMEINDINGNITFDENITGDAKEKMDQKWSEFLYTYNLILLYFQDGSKTDIFNSISNDQIILSTRDLRDQVKNIRYQRMGIHKDSFYTLGVKPFRNSMRKYLKGEWDRAKSGT